MDSSFQQRSLIPTSQSPHKNPLPPPSTTTTTTTMASTSLSFIHLALCSTFLLVVLLSPYAEAQKASAPAPSPALLNLTGILDKNGQFKTFIRLLGSSQIGDQIKNQLKSSTEGMTVFAPTDNAFSNLKAGTLNGLSDQEQVQLLLYHVIPKFYSLETLLTVSNPVQTQATVPDGGGVLGLNFTGQGNQVNVSTGMVETQINNVLQDQSPLAVYQVDKVLLPPELFEARPPASPPPPAKAPAASTKNVTADAEEPSASEKSDDSGSEGRHVKLGLSTVGVGLIFMELLLW